MKSLRTAVILGCVLLMASASCATRQQFGKADAPSMPTAYLWPNGAPGALGTAEVDKPLITIQLPKKTHGGKPTPAVVVCPGGGYSGLAWDYEGEEVAAWLNTQGIAGFVLRYRHGAKYGHPIPLSDAQRAIRMVRSRASEWNVDPHRIGILGFSAGGHLTTTAATHFDPGNPAAPDALDRVSSRPDFQVPIYPVISMDDPHTHAGSRKNLLGENPERSLIELLSNERQVTADTPPAFIVHSTADAAVPVQNSLAYYAACVENGVPAELHVYEKGKHGFGMGKGDPALSTWPRLLIMWLEKRGIVDAAGD